MSANNSFVNFNRRKFSLNNCLFLIIQAALRKKVSAALKVLNEKNMLKLFQLKQEKRSRNVYLAFLSKLFAGHKFPSVLIYTHTHTHTHTHPHTHKHTHWLRLLLQQTNIILYSSSDKIPNNLINYGIWKRTPSKLPLRSKGNKRIVRLLAPLCFN